MGFDFTLIAPLLPSHCGFSSVLGRGVSSLVQSSVFLSMIVQQPVVILVLSQEGVRARPSTPPSCLISSYGNFISNYLGNCQTVSHSGCNILHSYQQCMRVPISPHSPKQLLISIFNFYNPSGWEVALICIFLMTNDIEHLMCLLDIYISSLEKYLFNSFAHFYLGCLFVVEL